MHLNANIIDNFQTGDKNRKVSIYIRHIVHKMNIVFLPYISYNIYIYLYTLTCLNMIIRLKFIFKFETL